MTTSIIYNCAYCGEPNETFVDESGAAKQDYTEDCAVCCRPNVLHVTINIESGEVSVENEFEG